MKVLVTGGAGFIGSNFILHMLSNHPECRIVNLDKLTYAGNLENVRDASRDPRYTFVRGDICDAAVVETILRDRVDAIVNFAAESHVDRSISDAAPFISTNISGTHVLLEGARKFGVAKYIQVSTDEVYGAIGPRGTFDENAHLHPSNPYSASKAAGDMLALAYHQTHGMPVIVTRCSNNYGPFQFPEKFIPLTITNALEGKPVPVYGDGLQMRDWIHTSDHCRALDLILERGTPGRVYNIGGEKDITNITVAKKILSLMNKPESLLASVKDRPGHDRRYAIDSSRLEHELGWTARIAFDAGLRDTVEWYMKNEKWWRDIKSGEYTRYYQEQYGTA